MARGNFLRSDYYNYINSSLDLLFELSAKGDISAQYVLGVLLLKEHPITKDSLQTKAVKNAIRNLDRAAQSQCIDAILELIYVYKQILKVVDTKKDQDIYNNKIYELKDLLRLQVSFINKQLAFIEDDIDPYTTRFPKPTTSDKVKYVKDYSDLIDFTTKLNDLCKSLQGEEKETVSEASMLEAKEIVDTMKPKTINDVLLYSVSLNMLNTFVKQKQRQITYYFKNNVIDVLVNSIIDNNIEDAIYTITYDRGMTICYIQVFGIIFSFHQVIIPDSIKDKIFNYKGCKPIVFDNVRKQKLAVTLYYNVKEYLK